MKCALFRIAETSGMYVIRQEGNIMGEGLGRFICFNVRNEEKRQ